MATIAAVIASTHHPFYYRASTSTGADRPPFADEWVAKITSFRETLTRANPDVLVLVGSDHFHQIWLDNMPQFLVGKAPFYDANWYNEEREFGLPRLFFKGDENLSSHILRSGLDAGFDLAFSNELRIDHSVTCPMITLRPECDLPIVPIYTNIFAPPLPQPKRYVQLGQMIRDVVESWPSNLRVPAGRDHRHGAPLARARRPAPVRPARPRPGVRPQGRRLDRLGRHREGTRRGFARVAVGAGQRHARFPGLHADDGRRRSRGEGRLRRHPRPVPHDGGLLHLVPELWEPGNATHGFLDFMLMMGVAGAGEKADYVDTLDLFHTMEAYFTWYPKGGVA